MKTLRIGLGALLLMMMAGGCFSTTGSTKSTGPTAAAPSAPAPEQTPERLAWINAGQARSAARAAVTLKLPDADLRRYLEGFVTYVEPADRPGRGSIWVDWTGREAVEVRKGALPSEDQVRVRKIRVNLTVEGRLISVQETEAWLARGPD